MNWYKKSRLKKTATMNVMVADYQYPRSKKTISDLGNYLQDYLIYKTDFQTRLTEFEKAYWMKNKAHEFITMDGLDVDSETGTINIYLAGLPDKMIPIIHEYDWKPYCKAVIIPVKFNLNLIKSEKGLCASSNGDGEKSRKDEIKDKDLWDELIQLASERIKLFDTQEMDYNGNTEFENTGCVRDLATLMRKK